MPTIDQHPSSTNTKILLIGDPGSGKTGSLAALAHAGYNLRIADLDNGLDILHNLLTDPKTPYDKEAYKRVNYITLTEKTAKFIPTGGFTAPTTATVWSRLVGYLNRWEDLGPVSSWTENDVLVLDSLTLAGIAAFNFSATLNIGTKDNRQIYFSAQNMLENLLQILYGDNIKCNIVVTSHISFIGEDTVAMHGYPTTIGRALSTKIGRYFNSILMVRTDGKNRRIYTNPISRVELKNSAPLRVKEHYDIKFGLAEFFADVRAPVAAPAVAVPTPA